MTDSLELFLTPPEVAKLLRVSPEKVLGWVRKGELRAINLSGGYRPRYRIRRYDLDLFLQSREVQPPPKRTRQNHRMRQNGPCPDGGPIDRILGEELAKKGEARQVCGKYYRVWNGVTQFV